MGRKEVRTPSQLKVGGSWASECRYDRGTEDHCGGRVGEIREAQDRKLKQEQGTFLKYN